MRHVTLVCGPPCSGKSTYVAQHAQPGELIACHDTEARRAGSPRTHDHLPGHRAAAEVAYWRLVERIAASHDGRAWVIRTAPRPEQRQQLAEQLRADRVVVLAPPMAAVLHRAELDRRSRRTFGLIRGWYDRYAPAPCDTDVIGAEPVTSRAW